MPAMPTEFLADHFSTVVGHYAPTVEAVGHLVNQCYQSQGFLIITIVRWACMSIARLVAVDAIARHQCTAKIDA